MFITVTTYEGIEISVMIARIQHFADNRIYLIGAEPAWLDVRQTKAEIGDMVNKEMR